MVGFNLTFSDVQNTFECSFRYSKLFLLVVKFKKASPLEKFSVINNKQFITLIKRSDRMVLIKKKEDK